MPKFTQLFYQKEFLFYANQRFLETYRASANCFHFFANFAAILKMKVWNDIYEFSALNPVVTIGIFDGVHKGHLYLLNELKKQASSSGGETVALTLWPHPRIVLNREPEKLRYLTSLEEKIMLLEKSDIDHLIILPFTREFSLLSSCDFIEQYLVKKVRLHKLIVGYNHKFGHNREGGFENLKECAGKYNFEIQRLEPALAGGEKVSSSIIRELLLKGELGMANHFLGYDFFLKGSVIEGNKIGRQIGFPTANIQPSDEHKLIPKSGVYAVHVEKDGLMYKGMLNIGFRPTLNSEMEQKSIEVHLIDFKGDIYNKDIELHFRSYMREEKKFDSLEQLKDQLVIDKRKAIEVLHKF